MVMFAPLIAGAIGAAAGAGAVAAGLTAATVTMATAIEIGWTVGTLLYSVYQFANQEVTESTYTGPKLGDLQVQSAAWGKPIPRLYGTYRVAGEVIWSLPLKETEHIDEESSGKGGGGTKTSRIWYTYSASWTVAFCESEMAGINKIWFDNVLVYDGFNYDSQSGLEEYNWQVYNGSTTQPKDWIMESDNPEWTPAYRGIFYIVFNDIELENTGNRIPNVTVELSQDYTIEYKVNSISNIPSIITDNIGYPYALGGLCPRNTDGMGILRLGHWDDTTPIGHPDEIILETKTINNDDYLISPTLVSYMDSVYHYGQGYRKLGGCSNILSDVEGHTPESPHFIYKLFHTSLQIDKKTTIETDIELVDIQKWYCTYGHLMAVGIPGGITLDDKKIFITVINTEEPVGTDVVTAVLDGWTNEVDNTQYIIDISTIPEIPGTEYILEVSESNNIIYIRTTSGTIYKTTITGTYIGTLGVSTNVNTRGDSGFMVIYGNKLHLITKTYIAYVIDMHSYFVASLDISSNITSIDFKYDSMSASSGLFTICSSVNNNVISFSILSIDSTQKLSNILIDLFDRSGLISTEYDVTALEDIDVKGFIISKESSTRDVIQELIFTFNFELIEADGILRAQKLIDSPYKVQIPVDDIIGEIDYTKKQEIELPRSVSFQYMNKESDYNSGVQTAIRINTASSEVNNFGTAAVLSDSEAKQQAEILLYTIWIADESLSFSVSSTYLTTYDLNPGDIINVQYEEFTKTLKISSIKINSNNTLELTCVSYYYGSYSSNAIGSNTDNSDAIVNLQGPSKLLILDIPNINNNVDVEGLYLSATGILPNWSGCNIMTIDQTGSPVILDSILGYTKTGIADTALAVGPSTVWDLVNSFTVYMYGDQVPYSTTPELLLSGTVNYAMLGKEMLQFQDVTPLGNNKYVLSTLLRGRHGTESEMALHVEDETFIILDTNIVFDYNAKKNIESYYKAVTFGLFPDTEAWDAFTPEIIRLKPLNVTMVEHEIVAPDIEIYWTRRSREVRGKLMQMRLFEEASSYEIDLYISDVLKHTYTTLDLTTNLIYADSGGTKYNCKFIYLEADQITHGYTGIAGTLKVVIYQISTTVGRGFPTEYII